MDTPCRVCVWKHVRQATTSRVSEEQWLRCICETEERPTAFAFELLFKKNLNTGCDIPGTFIYYLIVRNAKKKQGWRQRHTSKNLPGVQAVFHYSNHRSVLTHMIASYLVCGALQWSLMTKIEDRDSPPVAICGLCMFVLRLMHWFLF